VNHDQYESDHDESDVSNTEQRDVVTDMRPHFQSSLDFAKPSRFSADKNMAHAQASPFVHLDHFAPRGNIQTSAVFTRRAADYRQSPMYDLNPAPASRLLQRANALTITDASGRTYWDATQAYNHPNEAWIDTYKNSAMYRIGDHVLVVQNKLRDSANFTSFPTNGRIVFTTHYPMSRAQKTDPVRTFHVHASVVHTAHYQSGARARKTCLILVRGPLFYSHHA
jgi:hypothetical protein